MDWLKTGEERLERWTGSKHKGILAQYIEPDSKKVLFFYNLLAK